MKELLQSFREAAVEAPRIYFAPLVGVIQALRAEWKRLDTKQEDLKHPTLPAATSNLDDDIDGSSGVLQNIASSLPATDPHHH